MDLTATYLGLTLKNPLIASASPMNCELRNLRHLEDAGAAAVVLPSLFEEQIELGSKDGWLYEGWEATATMKRSPIFRQPTPIGFNQSPIST